MENIIMQIDWLTLVVVSIAVSFIVEAINNVTPKWLSPKLLLFIVAIVVTLLKIQFNFESFVGVQEFLFSVLITISFSILFYEYMGKYIVEKVFSVILKKIEKDAEEIK